MKHLLVTFALIFTLESCVSNKKVPAPVAKADKEIKVKSKKRQKKEISATGAAFTLFIYFSLKMIGTIK